MRPAQLGSGYDARGAIPDHLNILADRERRSERERTSRTCRLGLNGPREKPDLVQSGIGLSGVYELEPLIQTSINDVAGSKPATARRNNPFLLKPATRAPRAVATSGLATAEFYRQAQALTTARPKYGVPVSMPDVPGTNSFTNPEHIAADAVLPKQGVELPGKVTESRRSRPHP